MYDVDGCENLKKRRGQGGEGGQAMAAVLAANRTRPDGVLAVLAFQLTLQRIAKPHVAHRTAQRIQTAC